MKLKKLKIDNMWKYHDATSIYISSKVFYKIRLYYSKIQKTRKNAEYSLEFHEKMTNPVVDLQAGQNFEKVSQTFKILFRFC